MAIAGLVLGIIALSLDILAVAGVATFFTTLSETITESSATML